MSQNSDVGPRETARDVLDYLRFAGFELTVEQLKRLHRQRLVDRPFHNANGIRGPKTTYPAGTAERMLRIARLETQSRKLDELAWRLWWEGSKVEPDLVRDYLVKMANRWDDRLGDVHGNSTSNGAEEILVGERDVLDEVFFQHLTLVPSTAAERKRLEKGSKVYVEFAAILTELLSGDFTTTVEKDAGIFERLDYRSFELKMEQEDARERHSTALQTLQEAAALPYAEVVQSLTAKQIQKARPLAFLLSQVIGSVGEIMNDLFGTPGQGRELAGNSLVAMSDSPEEQVLSLLLSTSLLKHKRIRRKLPHFEASSIASPAVSFQDFLRLRYLVKEIPGLDKQVTPRRMRNAFESPEGAERWRAGFEEFLLAHLEEFEEAMAERPDLFEAPPGGEEVTNSSRSKVKSKKKTEKTKRR